ncbi:MAG: class II fructose-bisphosphatase [Chloroflexales bacterium]|nr:class II fructose-bisphosphatase [Chloroflexales bacterium]
MPTIEKPNRNLALELVRVTEAAALAAGRWMGRGNKEAGDQAAVDAMRLVLGTVAMDGVVVIGEGEKDEAPMLYNGEKIGNGRPPVVEIAVDPLEGTNLLAMGLPNALAVVALAERDAMWSPGSGFYMEKIVVGKAARGAVDITAPPEDNIRSVAKAVDKAVEDLTLVVLNRPRNKYIIDAARKLGARITLISDGDVAGSLMAALPATGIDMLMGIGGTPEGVITACALICLGGEIQGRLAPQSEAERARLIEEGHQLDRVLKTGDLVRSDNVFFAATGVTSGPLLQGVQYFHGGATTESLVMRGHSGTVRRIHATHQFDKLMQFSAVPYAAVEA